MLNWIIDFSLRHRFLVIAGVAGAGGGRRRVAALSGHRRLPRHDAGAGADQHRRAGARAGGGRAADHVPDRAGDRRPAAAWRACGRSRSSASRRSSSPSRTAPTSTSPGSSSTSGWPPSSWPRASAGPKMGPVATGLGEVFHYVVTGEGNDVTELRTIHDWVIKPKMRTVPGRRRDQQLGRLREAVPGADRPEPAHQARPDVRRGRAGGRGEQPQRRRRQHPRGHADAVLVQGVGRTTNVDADRRRSSSPPRTACRSASATWPRWRSARRSAAAPSPPTARARSCSASASC